MGSFFVYIKLYARTRKGMGLKYSQNLIGRTINHFKKKYDLDISPETADVYLASFAVVFRSFSKVEQRGRSVSDTNLLVRNGTSFDDIKN